MVALRHPSPDFMSLGYSFAGSRLNYKLRQLYLVSRPVLLPSAKSLSNQEMNFFMSTQKGIAHKPTAAQTVCLEPPLKGHCLRHSSSLPTENSFPIVTVEWMAKFFRSSYELQNDYEVLSSTQHSRELIGN